MFISCNYLHSIIRFNKWFGVLKKTILQAATLILPGLVVKKQLVAWRGKYFGMWSADDVCVNVTTWQVKHFNFKKCLAFRCGLRHVQSWRKEKLRCSARSLFLEGCGAWHLGVACWRREYARVPLGGKSCLAEVNKSLLPQAWTEVSYVWQRRRTQLCHLDLRSVFWSAGCG